MNIHSTQYLLISKRFNFLLFVLVLGAFISFHSKGQTKNLDFLYDQKFIIDDSYENGDYVCKVNLLRGKSDGSERFSLSGGDTDAFMINSSTGVITVRDATRINGPDNMQVTVSGTLNGHANNTCTIDIQVYTIQDEFFVATNGSNSNNGRSAGSAWATISYAVGQVSAGDKVWIKAGNYGNENIVTSNDGTSSLPIVYEGYKTSPGDIIGHDWYSFGDDLDSVEMPLLDGGDRTTGYAMTLTSTDYHIWKNLQIQNYDIGIYAGTCTGSVLENIIAIQFGGITANTGIGFNLKRHTNCMVINCNVGNAGNTGILLTGNYSIMDNCKVYANEGPLSWALATDYYISIQGTYNIVYNCYTERIGELRHFGHGINLNGSDMATTNNLIKNCETNNLGEGFVVRKPNVTYNIIEDCKVTEGSDDLEGGGAAITIRNGASYNTFRRIEVVDAWHGICLSNKTSETDELFCGRHNTIEYCKFINTQHAIIDFNGYNNSRIADWNTVSNCVIDGSGVSSDFLFNSDRENANNLLVNCIITGVGNYLDQVQYPGVYDLNAELENCNFYNNGFTVPAGSNITTYDPFFKDLSNHDYHLLPGSQCINNGKSVGLLNDFDGIEISGLPDIGAFEYIDGGSSVLVSTITVSGQGGTTVISTNNGTLQMNASVLPSDATDKTITWSVENGSGQATISSLGVLQAGSDGTVTVKATANDGSDIVGSLDITISNQSILVSSINVTGQGGATTISTDNGTLQMSASLSPSDATDKTVSWSVIAGTGAATISIAGLLLAASNGTVTVRAAANDGSGVIGERIITISNQMIPVSSISVSGQGGSSAIITYHGTLQMNANVLPSDATNKSVAWSVINGTGQATINSSGLLTAVSNGTVTVRATANDGSGVQGSLVVTISNQTILVSSISVSGQGGSTSISVNNGSLQMIANVLPTDATNKSVTWSVINGTGQASINSSGLLTAGSNGTVTVRATANDGSGVQGSLQITITNQLVLVSSISVSGQGGSSVISSDNGTLQMNANVLPSDATNKNVSWSVVNSTGEATINSSGLLQAVSSGTVTVRATATDGSGVQGSLLVTITNQLIPVTSISVTGQGGSTVINVDNGTLQINANVLPSDATIRTVTWSVSNGTGQATISSSGLLQAVSNGTVTVRATAEDGSGVQGSVTITISNQFVHITSITVQGQGGVITVDRGSTLQMIASVLPANATNSSVSWSVSNGSGQATINSSGLLQANSDGTVTVIASANDGSGVQGSAQISITSQFIPVSSISVGGSGGVNTINTNGGTLQMNATILPSNANNSSVTWSVINGSGEATINSTGLLTAVSNGTVTVIATADDGSGVQGSVQITISNQYVHVSSIVVQGAGGQTQINTDNGSLQMNASVLPSNATNTTVTWSVINGTGEAIINSSGLLQSISSGTLTVVASANDGSGVQGTAVITIINQAILVSSISVHGEGGASTINTDGGTLQMDAVVLPSDATNKDINWSIINGTGEAIISDFGYMQAISDGSVTVLATATDGTGIEGSLDILISNQSSGGDNYPTELMLVYPNPTTGLTTVETNEDSPGILVLKVFHSDGQYITSIPMESNRETVDFSSYNNGMYILQLYHGIRLLGTVNLIKQ